jgi:hypothetical protein
MQASQAQKQRQPLGHISAFAILHHFSDINTVISFLGLTLSIQHINNEFY